MGRTTFHYYKKLNLLIEFFSANNLRVNHLQPWVPGQITVGENMKFLQRIIGEYETSWRILRSIDRSKGSSGANFSGRSKEHGCKFTMKKATLIF